MTRAHTLDRQIKASRGWWIAFRLLTVIAGGYLASSALVAGLSDVLPRLGMPRSESVVLASMLGFPIFLAVLIAGFSEKRVSRIIIGGLMLSTVGLILVWLPEF